MAASTATSNWQPLSPLLSRHLAESRLQLHYAAQFATALGISFLDPKPDDSHTNLGWDPKLQALGSRAVQGPSNRVRIAVRPRDLTLLVLVNESVSEDIPLDGWTVDQIQSALRSALQNAGLDGRRYTLRRHYELPSHPVASGDPFRVSRPELFEELASWYSNASVVLEDMRTRTGGAEVRCWPHHFDIATLVTFQPGRSSGLAMLPGDAMFPEPYYYVNAYPAPKAMPDESMLQGVIWNSDGWFGAVLRGSQLSAEPSAQAAQVRDFLDAAFKTTSALLTNQL